MPAGLSRAHVTTVWAELVVLAGSVLFIEEAQRRIEAASGDRVLIVPGTYHHVKPSEDAEFFVQFYDSGKRERPRFSGSATQAEPAG